MDNGDVKKFDKKKKLVHRPRDMNGITTTCDEFYKYLSYIS